MPADAPHRTVRTLLLVAVLAAMAGAVGAALTLGPLLAPPPPRMPEGYIGAALLLLLAGVVLAIGLVPAGAVAVAAAAPPGVWRWAGGALGALAGLALAFLAALAATAVMELMVEGTARPLLPVLAPLPFLVAALAGQAVLRGGAAGVGWAAAGIVLLGMLLLRVVSL